MKKSSKKLLFLLVFASLGTLAATACTDNDQTNNSSLITKDKNSPEQTSENGKQEVKTTSDSSTASKNEKESTSSETMGEGVDSKSPGSASQNTEKSHQKNPAKTDAQKTNMDHAPGSVPSSQDQGESHPNQMGTNSGKSPSKEKPKATEEETKTNIGEQDTQQSPQPMSPNQESGSGAKTAPAAPGGSSPQTGETQHESVPKAQE